jgi:hypothetical protein
MEGIRPIGRCRTGNLGTLGNVGLGAVDCVDGPALEEHGSATAGAITVSDTTTEAAVALATVVVRRRARAGMSPFRP